MNKKQTNVLLVDDEPIILSTVKTALLNAGYGVTATSSAGEAFARLPELRPDILVTDIAMVGMDGLDLLREAKKLDPDVTAIMITGYCDVGSAIESLRLGAEDFLSKPFDFDEFLLRVAQCAEKRELRRKIRLYEKIVPVCSVCRKIRDDQGREPGTGEWLPLEAYLSRAAGILCSHSYCPDCATEACRR
jgi:DNA-binding NtrC family response regulator